jgi:hypothetical protein
LASHHAAQAGRAKARDVAHEEIWNDAKDAFSDGEGEEAEDGERSQAADIRAWQKAEHYQDMAKSAKYIMARNSRRDLHPAQSISKEELREYTKEQIAHDVLLVGDLEALIPQSGMFHMRNNANKNARISPREEFAPKERVVSSMEKEVRKERKGEQSEMYVLKADWRVGGEHVLGEVGNKSEERGENESARGETQKAPSVGEMEKGAKHRPEKVALGIFGSATDVILKGRPKKEANRGRFS